MSADFESAVLQKLDGLAQKFAPAQEFALLKDETTKTLAQLKDEANAVRAKLIEIEKHNAQVRTFRPATKSGEVSYDCGEFIGALALAGGIRGGKIKDNRSQEMVEKIIGKTALSSSDIPLPTGYAGEVAELVSKWGAARQYGTVYPLGYGVTNLPRLKTDTTFTLLTAGSAITEKSPQTEWVTFTAEKFGGLIVVPSEIDADCLFALGNFLARYCARNIARAEDWQFFASTAGGSGVNGSASGLKKLVVDNSKTVASGTYASPSEFTLAHFRSIRKVVDAPVLSNGAYYMHPTMEGQLSGLNTAGDKPYLANGLNGATLDGYPIRWVDSLPPLIAGDATSTVHVLFGDLSFMYLGVRGGPDIATSTEAGFSSDVIYVRGMERMTTGLMATGAVSGLITHSS